MQDWQLAYYSDVKMQMLAKLYGEMFNALDPPKKVDFLQVFLIEFPDREDKPIFLVERFIDGEYTKHNSNNGFVGVDGRRTPQAYSHFTWVASNREMIIVDIQGVSKRRREEMGCTYMEVCKGIRCW
jgi:elongation factor 2 kinase